MKWTNEQVDHLKELCYEGVSNADLAKEFGVAVTDIYAKRSALGITRAKCAVGKPARRSGMNKAKIIAELKQILADANMNQHEFCQERGIKDEHYFPFFVGWSMHAVERIVEEVEGTV